MTLGSAVVLTLILGASGAYASDNQCGGRVFGVGAGEGGFCILINPTQGNCPTAACANRLCQSDTVGYHRDMVAALLVAAATGKTVSLGWNNAEPCAFINASIYP